MKTEIENKLEFTEKSFGIAIKEFIDAERNRKLMKHANVIQLQEPGVIKNILWNLFKSA